MGEDGPVLIAGAGMAGSLLALTLGRQGIPVVVVDPHRDPKPVFRNEKLGPAQIAILERLGALAPFEETCWPKDAYGGRARPPLRDCGAPYHRWLAAVRRAWPANVGFVEASIVSASTSAQTQTVTLSDGRVLEGRLLVLATGRMPSLAQALGVGRTVLSAGHSVCLGFSVEGDDTTEAQVIPAAFGTGLGYVSVFPMPGELRVNVFSYRPLDDPWTRRMRTDPIAALAELAPGPASLLQGRRVVRRCEARGTDIYRATGHEAQAGLVLLGDAAYAPCPASGTGMLRILTDVEALSARCVPAWLATPGMGAEKIAQFYADPAKQRCEAASLRRSLDGRTSALSRSPVWRARRASRLARQTLAQGFRSRTRTPMQAGASRSARTDGEDLQFAAGHLDHVARLAPQDRARHR